jgi:hypothetical protein
MPPRTKKTDATPAAPVVVTAPAAVVAAPPKASRARKAPAAAAPAAPAPAPAATPAKAEKKPRRSYRLVTENVTNVNGPAFDAAAYAQVTDSRKRVFFNFTGHGPLQAAKKAFTQIRKFVNAEVCSYRFYVADKNDKSTGYVFHCPWINLI